MKTLEPAITYLEAAYLVVRDGVIAPWVDVEADQRSAGHWGIEQSSERHCAAVARTSAVNTPYTVWPTLLGIRGTSAYRSV